MVYGISQQDTHENISDIILLGEPGLLREWDEGCFMQKSGKEGCFNLEGIRDRMSAMG